jgi:hypothetical protein
MRIASESQRYFSPPQIAEQYAIDPHKVVGWIRRGELKAIDVATHTGGRPRYRVSSESLAEFEAKRSANPQPKISRIRRRRTDPTIHEYF